MSITDRLDPIADAAALVRSIHEHDLEGRHAILAEADHEAIALVLAHVLTRVLRIPAGGCRHCVSDFLADWQEDVRRALAAVTEPEGTP